MGRMMMVPVKGESATGEWVSDFYPTGVHVQCEVCSGVKMGIGYESDYIG